MTPPVLRTPRLTLRPLQASDAAAIAEGVGNWDVVRWLSVVPYPYALADAETFIAKTLASDALTWAICGGDALVGVISISDECELGYWLARPAWREGIGFEAANAVVSHWFADPRREDINSGHFADNLRSGAVLRALGFVETGHRKVPSVALSQDVDSMGLILSRAAWEKRMAFRVETPRFVLRPLRDQDAADLAALAVPEVARMLAGLPVPLPIEVAREVIEDRRWRGHSGFHIAITQSDRLIGIIGCTRQPPEIMYAIHPDHWGKGIATEAVGAFLTALFARLPFNAFRASHMVDNPASGAVLRKLGFKETGTGNCTSQARLEAVPSITYALSREDVDQ